MRYRLFLILWLTLLSCGNDFGSMVMGENLTVYYVNNSDKDLAEKVAVYWKENDLLTGEKQDLQIFRDEKELQLRIIANNTTDVKNMPFKERKLLIEFQNEMRDQLAQPTLELVISDANFKPLYNINK